MFNDYLLRSAFAGVTHPDVFDFVLLLDGVPVGDMEQVRASAFTVEHGSVTGPPVVFRTAARFDAVGMYAAGELVETFPVGVSEMPAGMAFEVRAVPRIGAGVIPLLRRVLVCPNDCGHRALEPPAPVEAGGGAATLHDCPTLRGMSVPLVPEGTKAAARAHEREDYVAGERVRVDADGRPVMSVTVERDDGQDCVVFAPTATAGVEVGH